MNHHKTRTGQNSSEACCYLLHYERPLSNDPKSHPRQHYLGTVKQADKLEDRLDLHRNGQGARFCAVAKERGISFVLARTWPGGRDVERALKAKKHASRFCPVCNPDKPV